MIHRYGNKPYYYRIFTLKSVDHGRTG